jgi:outer membrane protein OmpA-like peptidoglycan-associated protein
MKRFFAIAALAVFLFQFELLPAQQYQLSSANKKALKYYQAAEVAYRQKDLETAATTLQKALKKDSGFIEAWLLLGDTYAGLNQKENAIEAYEEAVRIDPDFFPQVYYFLGKLKYDTGQYPQSVRYFKGFLDYSEISRERRLLGVQGLNRAKFAVDAVHNPVCKQPENVGDSINTIADEYINFVNVTTDEIILTRKVSQAAGSVNVHLFAEGFFTSFLVNNEWSQPSPLTLSWKQNLNLGGMSISVDGRKMYFTGCQWPNSFGSCDLYVSLRKGSVWEAPSNLGTHVNSQWWDSQPVISANGKQLFFSSKRAGGKGGADIWMSVKLPDGKWSQPINLGDSINTPGDEMAPFLHADGKTLYFSSTGWTGLGGFDLFIARKDFAGQWSKVQNLGYPLNTNANEINIFVSLDGTKTWISSDRKSGEGGFDIYCLQTYRQIRPEKVMFVKGVVMDAMTGKLLEAKVVLTNLMNNRIEDSCTSDPLTGEFLMVLHPGTEYAFNISKKGYLFYSKNINLKDSVAKHVQQSFKLSPYKRGEQIVLNNIFFDFNSARLKAASQTELSNLLNMLKENKTLRLLISGHTDNVGKDSYNEKLSTERAFAVYSFLIQNGIDKSRLEYKGFGRSKPIASNASDEGRRINRRTEITVL